MIRRLIILLLIVGCENSTEPKQEDCAGVIGGTSVLDCAGVCGGGATIDDCGMCTGGTTSLVPNYLQDACGVCGGNNDCIDDKYGCTDPTACNFDSEATIFDNSCAYEYDCEYVCGGDAIIDECYICGGDGLNLTTINDVEWTFDEYTVSNTSLTATGMITNTGNSTILAPWWVEAEFFSDSTFTAIFGGNQQSFNVNLQSGVSIQWTLSWSSSNIIESNYPNFAIGNFRAFIFTCP